MATCSFVSTSMFGIYITCYPKWEEALEFTYHIPGYKVVGEVLVLGLLVVVYKIPYNSSCMWTRQDVIGVFPSLLLSIWCNVCTCHSPVYHYIAASVVYLVQRIIAVQLKLKTFDVVRVLVDCRSTQKSDKNTCSSRCIIIHLLWWLAQHSKERHPWYE